ncbi:McrC family protein [Falsihalocynthiibacter arcticus]|uniref:Restriction endonuclease n=1 Tax=Falsihalocynthiibacter arcticus TaxID=1579316 RepID=A0A126V239_9RHOB|nr:hypothetical protein [Falsihalocynthiibacter arcticus]AML51749.1 hypothetical protein RC74_11185 [Falsihalocynthiibacter arcticus]
MWQARREPDLFAVVRGGLIGSEPNHSIKSMEAFYDLVRDGEVKTAGGSVDVARQFTRYAVNPSRLACQFDDLSVDTALNQIIKAAVMHLAKLSRSSSNQQRLRELAFVYASVSEIQPSALPWADETIDRSNRQWFDPFEMAGLFLQNRYQTTTGGTGRGTALLFEMNTLFEEYVGRQISRALAGTELTVSLQGGRRYCLTSVDTERGHFQTKPDILIRRAGTVTHVIDAKWKRISSQIDDPKLGVSQSDVYQMMAYAQLYGAPRLTLLYPHHPGLGSEELVHARHRITGCETILETASIDVANGSNILERLLGLIVAGEVLT